MGQAWGSEVCGAVAQAGQTMFLAVMFWGRAMQSCMLLLLLPFRSILVIPLNPCRVPIQIPFYLAAAAALLCLCFHCARYAAAAGAVIEKSHATAEKVVSSFMQSAHKQTIDICQWLRLGPIVARTNRRPGQAADRVCVVSLSASCVFIYLAWRPTRESYGC